MYQTVISKFSHGNQPRSLLQYSKPGLCKLSCGLTVAFSFAVLRYLMARTGTKRIIPVIAQATVERKKKLSRKKKQKLRSIIIFKLICEF